MELFASPMACSLASHITALEAGLEYPDKVGGLVLLCPAVAFRKMRQFIPLVRKLNPSWASLPVPMTRKIAERYQLIDIQNYLATEVHKKLFQPIFTPQAPQAAKDAAKAQLEPTLDYLAKRLGDRETLVGTGFTVADAYLVTLLNWFAFVGCDLKKWPTINAYHQKHLKRPSVAQAMGVEMAERQRRLAA